ncbi:Lmo0850 family protein [Falsibacillus albus]|nr:Lmo0850 family protein [Falsibacillus albus]
MKRDHDQVKRVISQLGKIGVKISKTKSRLELRKALDDMKPIPNYPEAHS